MITTTPFGTAPSGSPVTVYNLVCAGARVRVMDYGATILSIEVPDASGDVADIALGFDALDGYFDNPACYGGTIGPSANRTDKGQIEIAGTVYQMACNDGPNKANNLHTDLEHGLHKRVWNATVDEITNTVSFTCKLVDGELGLPGNRTFTVAYVLQAGPTGAAELTCTQSCVTDADTFVNMTNHTYFNLAGHDAGTVLDYRRRGFPPPAPGQRLFWRGSPRGRYAIRFPRTQGARPRHRGERRAAQDCTGL